MGYFVYLTDSCAVLPKENLAEAYQRLCDLNKRDDLKTGGCWSNGEQTAAWFSWMPANYPEVCGTAKEILENVGYEIEVTSQGDLSLFAYDNKTGCEDIFVWAIIDLFTPEFFMEWRGEEGATWRWEQKDKKMTVSEGVVDWSHGAEFEPRGW